MTLGQNLHFQSQARLWIPVTAVCGIHWMPNMPHLVMLYSVCVWYVHLCVSVQVNVAQRSTFGVFLTLCLLSVCLKQPGVVSKKKCID